MTFDQAARFIEAHGNLWRASGKPDHIQARVEWTRSDGTKGFDWDDLPLSCRAIRDWLGY